MNEHSNPLDYILRCTEQGLVPKLFTVQNAKDELKQLRKQLASFKVVGYGHINERKDLYCLTLTHNPYLDQETIIPLYSNRKEFQSIDWTGYSYDRQKK
jgi:hypothetical protein